MGYHYSHQTEHYEFYRHDKSPTPKTITYTGHKLYIHLSAFHIQTYHGALQYLFDKADILFYLIIKNTFSCPGKNLIVYLGQDANTGRIGSLCRDLENFLRNHKVSPEITKSMMVNNTIRPIPASHYLSYSTDYDKDKPTVSVKRKFSHSDKVPVIEQSLQKPKKNI